jgi:hypothetical protein
MFLNNQSCPNQMLAFDPHIVTESGRIKPFLLGSTRRIGFWGFLTRKAEQISASISVRWEPDGIFAYHKG